MAIYRFRNFKGPWFPILQIVREVTLSRLLLMRGNNDLFNNIVEYFPLKKAFKIKNCIEQIVSPLDSLAYLSMSQLRRATWSTWASFNLEI